MPSDHDERLLILRRTAAGTHHEIDAMTLSVYLDELSDIPTPQLRAVCRQLVRTQRWFPRIPEILELCQPDAAKIANDRWGDVLTLLADSGNARHDDPVVNAVIRKMGGWEYLGHSKTDVVHSFKRKQFLELYALEVESQNRRELAAHVEPSQLPEGGKYPGREEAPSPRGWQEYQPPGGDP